MVMRPCLECGTPTQGGRCPAHPNLNRVARDRYTYTKSRRAFLEAWRAEHGDWCPGAFDLGHDPHPSADLTTDHVDGNAANNNPSNWRVLCRSANSAKGARR